MTLLRTLPDPATYKVTGSGQLPSAFAVTELATASLAAVGSELAGLIRALDLAKQQPQITVHQRLASLWYGYSFRPSGWDMPSLWDAIAGNYQCADGWIRLHTNLPHHRAAALQVLDCANTRDAVTTAVRKWQGDALEGAIVDGGGVAAAMRSQSDWLTHAQGQAVTSDPLIDWVAPRTVAMRPRPQATAERPLAGLRVLDLTRVLAGPIATRTLAGFGAEVLRIDPPGWDEPGVIPDISLGKRCTYLDLCHAQDRRTFETLLANADVLVHGYRPGALDGLGYDLEARGQLAPNLIEVTLNAYGWSGPWANRRGFDSLVQMSSGIAEAGRRWSGSDIPTPLPVQALDHATGYLMAATVLSALTAATQGNPVPQARLSLARTATLLADLSKDAVGSDITSAQNSDFAALPEHSGWGIGQRLTAPLSLSTTSMSWDLPASQLGTSGAIWL
ncbi:CoA transferase [Parasedimentitalea huanghaiensis]|uniref:Acyl-CoA transferase n=1 Tax=Parasedimentitalea huanghaiensis TaxID=2682100 RepID=A0A6L6WBB8_9RHOB|nr:CoA transferase [Zongyanglinia huanghaiensis]MVO14984.1 acyl-CoA transferase [Zongyanglinia huanghaiensis]